MISIRVTGADAIAKVAADCRRMSSDRRIVNDMSREIRGAVPPIRTAVRARAATILPQRGGLAAYVARSSVRGVVRRGADTAGVTIRVRTSPRSNTKGIDAGVVRHPTYAHRPWVNQAVPPGFATDAITEEGADQLEEACITAAENAARRLANG